MSRLTVFDAATLLVDGREVPLSEVSYSALPDPQTFADPKHVPTMTMTLGSVAEAVATPPGAIRERELWMELVRRTDISRFGIKMRMEVIWRSGRAPALLISMVANDRDTGEEVTLSFSAPMPPWFGPEKGVLWLRERLAQFLIHELDECMLVDGKRIYDPHDPRRAL